MPEAQAAVELCNWWSPWRCFSPPPSWGVGALLALQVGLLCTDAIATFVVGVCVVSLTSSSWSDVHQNSCLLFLLQLYWSLVTYNLCYSTGSKHNHYKTQGWWVIVGLLVFLVLEKMFPDRSGHEDPTPDSDLNSNTPVSAPAVILCLRRICSLLSKVVSQLTDLSEQDFKYFIALHNTHRSRVWFAFFSQGCRCFADWSIRWLTVQSAYRIHILL